MTCRYFSASSEDSKNYCGKPAINVNKVLFHADYRCIGCLKKIVGKTSLSNSYRNHPDTKMTLNNLEDFGKQYPQIIKCESWELKIECQLGPGYILRYYWRNCDKEWNTDENLNRTHNLFDHTDIGYDFAGWERPGILIFKNKSDCVLKKLI